MAKVKTSKSKRIGPCEKCKFFFRTKTTNTIGECHYNPPLYNASKTLNAFPRVDKDNFCGKYEDKPKKAAVGAVLRQKTRVGKMDRFRS